MTSSPFDLVALKDVPTSHAIIFAMFGCTNPALYVNSSHSGSYYHQFAKLNIKADNVKKLYEEVIFKKHYILFFKKKIK